MVGVTGQSVCHLPITHGTIDTATAIHLDSEDEETRCIAVAVSTGRRTY